jgi:hypothetical protein
MPNPNETLVEFQVLEILNLFPNFYFQITYVTNKITIAIMTFTLKTGAGCSSGALGATKPIVGCHNYKDCNLNDIS